MLLSQTVFYISALLFCSFGLLAREQDDANVEGRVPFREGAWVVISKTNSDVVGLDGDSMLYMASSFLAIAETIDSGIGNPIKQTLLYDLQWRRDPNDVQKWTATLYANPDPESGPEKHSKFTILGYVTCWISGDSGVLVFTEQEVSLSVASLQRLNNETSGYNIYSIYRKSDIGRHRLDFARKSMSQFGAPLRQPEKHLYGGWEHEIQAADKSNNR